MERDAVPGVLRANGPAVAFPCFHCRCFVRGKRAKGGRRMPSILMPPVGPEDHARGPANAPITLVEYGDYECPHCEVAFVVVKQVLEEVGDRVRFVFRNLPTIGAHPQAMPAPEAAKPVAAKGLE